MKRIVVLIIAIFMFSILAHAEEGDRYEAELASIYMCNNAGDHVAQIDNAGAYVEFILDETTAPGVYKLRIYYAAALEGNNSHTLFIDDEEIERIMYPQSELGWSTFSEDVYVETEVTLPTGVCTLRLEKTEEDEGFAELDAIRLIPVTLYTPEPTPEPTETPIPTKTEAPKPTKTQETTTEEKDSFNTLFVVVPAAVVVLAALVIVLIVKKKGIKTKTLLVLIICVLSVSLILVLFINKDNREVSFSMHNLDSIVLSPIPLGDIEAKGWLLNQLLLQKKNITGEFEDISPDVKTTGDDRSGWLGGSGESWERGPYYVRGLVYLAYALDDDSLKEKVQKWIDWVIESQIDNGQAGPKAGMPDFDYWAMMPMLIALTEYYDATEDERVIGFLDAYFRFQLDALKKDPLRDWGKARAGDNIYAAKWLYDKTKESYLVDLCNLLYNQADNWKSAYEKGNWGHIVNTHQSFKLFPLMFGMTGDKTYVDTYYSGVRNLFRTSGRIDGMSNGDEMSGDIEATRGTETCAVVEQMFSDIVAFRYLKDPRIGDSLEKVCFNALPSQLTPEITGQVYFTMQNQIEATLGYHGFSSDGGDRSVYGTPGGYPCCIHNFHMGWPLFASNLWFRTSDSGLLAFAYAPNAVKAQVGNNTNVMITQKTNYPFEDSILLKIEADNEETWPLYIRIPSWCDEAKIYVNGDFKGSCKEGSFVRLEAEWKSGDEVKIVLPMKIRTKFMQNNSVGVTYGPLVFCLFIEENWKKISYVSTDWKIPEKYSSYNITPKSNWNYALNLSEGFKVKRKKRYDYDNLVFKSVSVPIEIEAKGAIVESWEYDDRIKGASTLPISPVSEHGKEVKIRLIPYGFARLRASLMPWYGKEKVLYEPDFNVFDTVVAPVDKNDENARLGALPLGKYTGLIRCDVEKDSSIDVLVNGEIVDSVSLYKGEEYFSLPLPIMQNMYNRVEFKGDVSSVKIKSLEFDGKSEVFAYRWEAEHSIVLGNANNRGSHVGGIDKAGDGIAFKIHVSENNMYCFRIYYAAFFGDASHDLFVNGKKAAVVNYKKTDLGWGVFDDETYVEVFVPLTEGTHAISIQKTNLSTGFAEIDAVYVPWQ